MEHIGQGCGNQPMVCVVVGVRRISDRAIAESLMGKLTECRVVFADCEDALDRELEMRASSAFCLLLHETSDAARWIDVSRIIAKWPKAGLMVLGEGRTAQAIERPLTEGARGYIQSDSSIEDLVTAIRFVMAGQVYIPPSYLQKSIALRTNANGAMEEDHDAIGQSGRLLLESLMAGLRNKEIAARLGVPEATVKGRLQRLYRRLDVSNRAQAVRYAMEHGIDDEMIAN